MKLRTTLSLAIVALPVLFTAATAHAATPTPTSTGTPTATSTPAPPTTPSPQQVDTFRGQTWLNARISGGPVIAMIGDVTCSEPSVAITPADSTAPIYTLQVLSAESKPGCGREGEPITFYVEGQQAEPVALWHGGGDSTLDLIAGPPFARFYGTLSTQREPGESIVPFVGGQACGYDRGGGFVAPETTYETVVFFNQQQQGCGTEGSEVTFKLLNADRNVAAVAKEKGIWHPWYGVEQDTLNGPPENMPQQLNLTFAPATAIHVGNVGGGPAGPSPWLRLSVGLALAGLASGIAGFALRRRPGLRR